ncbi:MAG: type IV toxin-antitoxin system AbiEi family antitoxin domain-containing protein [Methylococcales bacterium]|nr:type IV toxin-antitoxin system AbiEi family antitoxin domain-containing protein [Methylococcales bacterium]
MTNRTKNKQIEAAKRVFHRHGGVMKTGEATAEGVHCRTLYAMRDTGTLERLGRGLYRLADLPPLSDPDLTIVARKIPKGVICLISALHFHNMTTQIPHAVSIAISRGTEPPRLEFPPIRVHWFSSEAFTAGIEEHTIENTTIRVYCAEKTLADCFKYRNKIGMDTVLEALKLYHENRKPSPVELLQFARVCRVENVMRPYLETLL